MKLNRRQIRSLIMEEIQEARNPTSVPYGGQYPGYPTLSSSPAGVLRGPTPPATEERPSRGQGKRSRKDQYRPGIGDSEAGRIQWEGLNKVVDSVKQSEPGIDDEKLFFELLALINKYTTKDNPELDDGYSE